MSTTAASISLNFEELQRELQAFNELFGLWTEQRRRALMDDKEAYLRTLAEEQDTVEALKKQYQQLLQQKQHVQEMLAAEEKELDENSRRNEEYTQQRNNLKQKLGLIVKETELLETEIMKESRVLEARNRTRELSREQRYADLHLYREKLGISICPSDENPNHLRVTFSKIDTQSPERPFKFCVDHTDSLNLRPFQFSPALPTEMLHALLATRPQADFYKLLCEVRSCFVKSLF